MQSLLHGEAGDLPARVRDRLERMSRNASRLASLVNDVLDLSKVEAGRIEVKWESIDAVAECAALMEEARAVAESPRSGSAVVAMFQ